MKTNNLSREYKIDYINEKIIISKKFMKAAGVFNSPEYTLMKSRFFVEQIRLFIYSYCVPKSPALLGTSFVGKDEVPGPNPGISSIKSPSDIDAEGDFFVS